MSQHLATLRFPCGKGGINHIKNRIDAAPTDLRMADGITCEGGTWRKEGGATRLNTDALGALVRGVFDFWTKDGIQIPIAVLASGEVKHITTGALLASGYGNGYPVFAEGWDEDTDKALYLANGLTQIKRYNGSFWRDIAGPNPDWNGTNGYPTGIFQHRARMVAYGLRSAPHDVFISLSSDHGIFNSPDASFRQGVGPGMGDGIVGGLSWREQAFFFKRPIGLYVLDDADPSPINWSIVPVNKSVGISGPGCAIEVDNDVLIWGTDGYFYSLNAVQNQGEKAATPLFPVELSDYLLRSFNIARLDLVQSVWYANKRQVHFAAPAAGSTVNDRRLIIDLMNGSLKVLESRRDSCPAIGLRRATVTSPLTPFIGDVDGHIWALDQTSRSKSGAGYRAQFETQPLPFDPDLSRKGNLCFLDCEFEPTGEFDVQVEILRDGKLSQTVAFSQQSAGGAVGSVSLDDAVLGGTMIQHRRRKVGGDALRASLIGYNNNANEDFSIQDLALRWKPGKAAS